MKNYVAKELVTLPAGSVVELTDKQAADRAPRMTRVSKGRYRLNEALQFKAGEAFGFDGDLPKTIANMVLTPEQLREEGEKEKAAAAAADKEAHERLFPVFVSELLAKLKPETASQVQAEIEALAKGEDGRKQGGLFGFLKK